MTPFAGLLRHLLSGKDLTREEAAQAVSGIMDGEYTPVQAAALLCALAAKGEAPDEVIGAARAMRERSLHVEHGLPLVLDVCGTGGDGAHTFNISTCVAFVVAGCGVPVAKHGNRASSSRCGSADVLEALGVAIDRGPEDASRLLESQRIAFMFAPRYHPAMKVVAPIRRELGIRTIFNLLGPLTNPARANRQVVGVALESHCRLLAEALNGLGAEAGAVLHSANGLDEIAGDAPTKIVQFDRHGFREWRLDPAEYGVRASLEEIAGGDARENASVLVKILNGEESPRAGLVALNAALALVVAQAAADLREGFALAQRSIASGAAIHALEALQRSDKVGLT